MKPFALVTGSSRGIGAATASALLARGWEVLGISRTEDDPNLGTDGYRHHRLDLVDLVRTAPWFADAFREIARFEQRPRIGLLNNAGRLAPQKPLSACGLRELDDALRLNVAVPMHLAGLFAGAATNGPCRIVDVSSGAATSPYPGWGAYCASKAALRMADEVLAVELEEIPDLAGRDVRVFSFAPGVVATKMQEQIRAASKDDFPRRERFERMHAEGELIDPAEPARAIADLLESGAGPRHVEERFEG